jgi:hypothetical protein
MPTRSTALIRGVAFGGGGAQQMGEVPAGQTWILKDAQISPAGLGSSTVQLYAEAPDGTRALFVQQTIANLGRAGVALWVVAEPGDTIWCNPGAVDQYVWISGAALPGVAP